MWAGSVTTWVKTDPTALTTNDVVVIVDQTSGKAMEANGTSAPKATDVTLKSDKSEISSGVIAAMQFKVTIGTTKIDNVDTRSYQFANGDNYLYCTNTNNGVKVGTNDANVFIIKKADANSEEDFIFNTTQSRYLGVYNNQDWRCYTTVNNNIKGTVTAFYKKVVVESADAPDAPTFSPVAGTYYTGQYVEISCTTEGATIKKSYDGENFETYNEAFPVMEDKTIWAYAEKNGEQSEIVSASYIIGSTYDSFAPMQEAAAAEGFSNKAIQYRATGGMVVAYVNGKNAYLIDGSGNGILAYNKDGLGDLAAGQKMNYDDGYLTATLENYQGNAELTGIVFPEMTGGTVTVTPVEKTLPLTSANQSTLVTLKGLTYNSSDQTFGDGTNTIKFYDKFKTNVVLENGKAYDVTGIVVLYNDVIEISPRTANDISEIITTAGALNAAAIAAGEEEKAVTFNFTNVKVVYAKYGYYYLADNDNSGYALLKGSQYGTEADMTTGSLITGTFTGTVSAKNGTPQASANSFSLTSKTADPNPRTPTTITIDQLGNNVNNYIKIENAELVQRLGNDITFKVGETTFKAYNSFALNVTLEEGKAYDIIGFGNYHAAPGNPIYYQILPTEITEVSTTPDPFYILGVNDANENDVWDIPDEFVEMTWDTENEAYTYELNNTTNAFFCFSTNNEVSDWDTFNSTYRWALGTGGDYTFDLDNLGTALELSQGNKTIVLPAGEWTISVTADKVLTITGEATPVGDTYIVAGSEAEIFGTSWDGTNEANKMTKQTDGTYQKTYTVDQAYEDVLLKVVKNGSEWIGDDNGDNVSFNLTGAGNFTVSIDPTTSKVTVTGDIVSFASTLDYESVYAVGNGEGAWLNGANWDPAYQDNQMTKVSDGVWEISFENVPAGSARNIKFAIDGAWTHNFGGTFSEFGEATDAVYNGDNIEFDTENDLQNIKVQLDLSNFDFTTKEGAKFTITSEPVEVPAGFRDIKVTLNDADMWQNKINSSGAASTVYITVDAEGNIGTTENADEAAATLKGYWHGAQYGWQKFSAEVPVEGCVKITLGASNYGTGAVIVTNSDGIQVAKIDNHTGAMWSTSNPDNVAVGYYRTNEPTTLTFSECDYIPYFAVEAIDEADLPAEVTNYNVTFAAGEGVEGVAPAAVEVEAGNKITAPANYTLYKDGSTLTGWSDGETTYAPGDEITPAADMQLTAVFTENAVSLADRTDAVTVTFPLNGYNNNPQHKLNNGGIIVTQVTIGESSIDVKADVTGSLVANGSGWHYASNSCAISVPSCKGASMTVTTYSNPSNAIKFENNAPKSVTGTANPYTASYETASTDATLAIAATSDIYISNIAITLPVVSGDDPTEDTELFSWVYDTSTTALDAVINGTNGSVTLKNTGTDAFSAEGATYTSKIADDMAPTKGLKFGKNTQYIVISLTEGNFQAGDEISVCGYNEIMFCASADRTNTIGDVATGSSKGDYKVGTFTIPENFTAQSTLYIFRKNGSGTGIAAIQAIRPGHDPNFVATPVITPKTGTYANEQEVTITCETENANIYYTLDGTDPTAQSTAYTDKFTVTETTTVKAIAIKGDYFSEIGESVITIVNIQPGESNLEWDYTDKNIPEEKEETDPMYEDNGLFYASFVNDKVGENVQNNGMNGVKLNSSGKAWFAKNPVAGKLTLTFGFRNSNDAFSVNVYECSIDGNTANRGNLIGSVSVDASPGTGSINIPAEVTGIWIERKTTSAEGVLSKIVFKETVQRTFQDFEITNEQLKGTVADMGLPEGVTLTGTQPAANNNAHGYISATIVVPTDGGAVKFTIGGCQYNNGTFTVKNSNNETVATLSSKTTSCYHQNGSVVTYFYTGEATTLTFSTIENLPYFKAEAVDVEEVTVTYKDQNGEVLGTKKVIEGSAIGEAPYTEADLTIAEGYAFRGWIYTNGVKVKATDIVDGNKTVMASVTAIEEAPTTGSIQVYDLTQTTFYPEDHENFDVNGGSWHDGQHGFSFGNGNSFSVKVSSKAQVVVTLCQHSSEGTVTVKDANNNSVGEGFNAKVASCGETAVVKYEGDATTLTFTFAATAYIHDVKVYNVNVFPEKDEATGYYMVPAGDAVALVLAINSASAEANSKIFLPNSTYDLGELVKTTISGTNVSIIGESMEGVIIKNAPTTEGIDVTATLLNTSSNLYMQDLTIECDAPWIGNAERGVTLQDKGNQTILKNVYLKGKQDTYYSNNPDGTFYFENGMIQGSVDYVCGYGDVYFNNTSFYTVNKSTGGKGGCIAAPNTLKSFGYIFNSCILDGQENENGLYRLARPWAADTKCFFVNTTMIIQPNAAGWGEWGTPNAVNRFAEYNSVDANSEAIDLNSRATTIGGQPNNPVLTEAEAADLAVDQIFAGDWKPQVIAQQVTAPKAELKDGVISWTPANDGATAYAIFKDGEFLGITTDSSWTVEEVAGAPHRAGEEPQTTGYTIRAANSRGGFGEPAEVSLATAITNINAELNGDVKIYDLQGRQVKTATKGVYIINGKKVVIK